MPTDWEANLRTLIKNTEKDADFLRLGSSWAYRVHKATESPVHSSVAGSLIGHSIEVHNRVYSTWIDKKTKKETIARANKALIKACK